MFYFEPFMERRRREEKIFVTELHKVFHKRMSSTLTTFMNATLTGYQCSQNFATVSKYLMSAFMLKFLPEFR